MIIATSVALANASPPINWNCSTVDGQGRIQEFVIVTNGGSPIHAEGNSEVVRGSVQSVASALEPTPREPDRLYLDHGTVRYSVTMPSADTVTRSAVVAIAQDLGSTWPFSRPLMMGICNGATRRNTPVPQSKANFFRELKTKTTMITALGAQWDADCWLVTPSRELFSFSMKVNLPENRARISVFTPKSTSWPIGPIELKGSSIGRYEVRQQDSPPIIAINSIVNGKADNEKIELYHYLYQFESGTAQSIFAWTSSGGPKRIMGAGTCAPVAIRWVKK